jgi:hypothetical protein
MGRRTRTFSAIAASALIAACCFAGSASATFHEMRIRAIFEGPSAHTGFIQLQMLAAGQNFTSGHVINYYDHTGALVHTSPPLPNVPNGANQSTILIGDTSTPGTPDLIWGTFRSNLVSDPSGGALCYENIDCVAWGSWAPVDLAKLASPEAAPLGGLSTTMVAIRGIGRGCPTALDPADDTNASASDFTFGFFTPRNNSVTPTETVCPPAPSPSTTTTKKCKKKKHRSAESAKKKKCKKKKHH